MISYECEFESEVLAAVVQGRWPGRVDGELREHAAGCTICSDVAVIAAGIEQQRESVTARAAIPDSGRVWWMAQLRARREAAEAANRPLTVAMLVALLCVAAVMGACWRIEWQWIQSAASRVAAVDWLGWLASGGRLVADHGALFLAVVGLVLLIPAAYFALGKD